MMKILKSIFNFFMLLVGISAYTQEVVPTTERIKGLRIGFDISKFALYYFEPDRKSLGFTADIETGKNFYPCIEYGMEKYNHHDSAQQYNEGTESAYIMRFGFDYNLLKNKAIDQYEMVFLGLRYGTSGYTQSVNNISIADPYWGGTIISSMPSSFSKAHWMEIVGGIRAELFKNFFVGWSFSSRILLARSKNSSFDPFLIPGYGRVGKKSNLGFNYSIFYRIPLYRSKKYVLAKKEK